MRNYCKNARDARFQVCSQIYQMNVTASQLCEYRMTRSEHKNETFKNL